MHAVSPRRISANEKTPAQTGVFLFIKSISFVTLVLYIAVLAPFRILSISPLGKIFLGAGGENKLLLTFDTNQNLGLELACSWLGGHGPPSLLFG